MKWVAKTCQSMCTGARAVTNSLPADASSNNTQRLVADFVLLIEHEPVGGPQFGRESTFSVVDGPFQLFNRDKDLAEDGIYSSLATVQASNSNDRVLVVKNEPDEVGVSRG